MSMLDNLREARNTAASAAEELLSASEVSAEALDAAEARAGEIKDLDAKIATAEALEARTRELAESRATAGVQTFGSAVIGKEQMTYDRNSDNSFVRDMINAQLRGDSDARARLVRHQSEVAVETRDINRTDTSGGDFVPPLYITNEYAELARAARVGADLLTKMALPAGTDSINIPRITTGTAVGFQSSDNSSTSNQDMVTATVTAPVRTISGYEGVSIQLVEQSPLSGGLDRMVFGDLMADYALKLNTAVVGNGDGTSGTLQGLTYLGINSGNSITYTASSPDGPGTQKAIAQAISGVVSNRYRAPEAIIISPSTWYWLASATDSQNRPLIVPSANGPFNANGVNTNPGAASGLVGSIHGVNVYVDATVPTINTNQLPIIAGKFSDSYLFESGVKSRVLPDVQSSTLTVRFQVYGYVALAHRFPKAVSVVSGTGVAKQTGF